MSLGHPLSLFLVIISGCLLNPKLGVGDRNLHNEVLGETVSSYGVAFSGLDHHGRSVLDYVLSFTAIVTLVNFFT